MHCSPHWTRGLHVLVSHTQHSWRQPYWPKGLIDQTSPIRQPFILTRHADGVWINGWPTGGVWFVRLCWPGVVTQMVAVTGMTPQAGCTSSSSDTDTAWCCWEGLNCVVWRRWLVCSVCWLAAFLYFPLLLLANEMEEVDGIGGSCWVWHFVLNSVSLSLDCV